MKLEIINNLTKQKLTFNVTDIYSSEIFFHFELMLQDNLEGIKTKDIVDGEYSYNLYDGEKKVAEGVLQIGDYKASTTVFNKEKKTYKVYGK